MPSPDSQSLAGDTSPSRNATSGRRKRGVAHSNVGPSAPATGLDPHGRCAAPLCPTSLTSRIEPYPQVTTPSRARTKKQRTELPAGSRSHNPIPSTPISHPGQLTGLRQLRGQSQSGRDSWKGPVCRAASAIHPVRPALRLRLGRWEDALVRKLIGLWLSDRRCHGKVQ